MPGTGDLLTRLLVSRPVRIPVLW